MRPGVVANLVAFRLDRSRGRTAAEEPAAKPYARSAPKGKVATARAANEDAKARSTGRSTSRGTSTTIRRSVVKRPRATSAGAPKAKRRTAK